MSPKALIVGTAGHVDHGKTSLVRALTGVNTDRWREEEERGLTIDIGFARLEAGPELEVGVVDVPGHEDFVKNMLAGATGIDLLVLVVAADEGPMPQTREHLAIARMLGVPTGVVALTKVDRVDEEWRVLVEEAVREELDRSLGHTNWPLIGVSSLDGTGIEEIRAAILSTLEATRPRDDEQLFRMPIDRCFTLAGAGTVVTGTVWSGRVLRGDTVRVLPADRSARVRSLQVHGESRDAVGAGHRCAMSLVGLDPNLAGRGATVTSHSGWCPVTRLGARIELLLDSAWLLRQGQRVRLYLGTREAMARVSLPTRELLPGAESWAALDLESPVLARVGDRFVIRFLSPVTTIGGGRVAELEPPRRWLGRTSDWELALRGSPAEAISAAVRLAGRRGVDRHMLPLVIHAADGLAALGGDAAVPEDVIECGGRLFSAAIVTAAQDAIISELNRMHRARRRSSAESLESLRATVAERFDATVVRRVISELAATEELSVEGPHVRLPNHRASLTVDETRRLAEVQRLIHEGGIAPPRVEDIRAALNMELDLMHDLLRLLVERGEVVPISSDLYLSSENERSVRVRARRVLESEGRADPAAFKNEFRVSRKYLIPLLEYLDRTGLTRRVGDSRELATTD